MRVIADPYPSLGATVRSYGLKSIIGFTGWYLNWIDWLLDAQTRSRGLQPVIMGHGMSFNSQSIVGKPVPCYYD